jgi:hypothetical protein
MTQPDALTTDLFAGSPVASWKQNLDRLDPILAAVTPGQIRLVVRPA